MIIMIKKFKESKWYSRKFLLTLFTLILIVVNEVIGLGIDPDLYWQIVGAVSAYILGESFVDGKREEDQNKK